ncbi:hypothetical protein [Cysteiniphilum sp. JM-1]|uniref:hypothetical protein n=1 Tax=Cysteiniphilum sp. JM-1 TaxID=2610891 RepID=UPI001243A54C|nr:hypothetical protein [Cysteiniphilum sp. JM-1]
MSEKRSQEDNDADLAKTTVAAKKNDENVIVNNPKEELKTAKKGNKENKISCWRGYIAIVVVVFVFAVLGLAASMFALYKQQNYNQTLQKLESVVITPVKTDDTAAKLLQSKLDAQTVKLDNQAKMIDDLKAKQTSQQNVVSEALKANQLNQVQLSQNVAQLKQSYLLPSSELSQQIQQMHKQAVVINLQFAKQAWQVLGSKAQSLFFLNQAKTLLMNVDGAAKWMPALDALMTQINNEPSIDESLIKINNLQQLLSSLHIQSPLTLAKNNYSGNNDLNEMNQQNQKNNWQDALSHSWQQMKSLIQVEKIKPQDQLLLSQHAQMKVLAGLYQLIWQLKLAVINNNSQMLAEVKAQFKQTLEQYFKADDSSKKMVTALAAINAVNVDVINSDIDALTNAILKGGNLSNKDILATQTKGNQP